MAEQPTCGQGLAAHAAIPAKLGDLIAAMADNLVAHMTALDLSDENGRRERDAYRSLAEGHRELAARLRATGEEMAGYRDLPMARHDPEVMASPALLEPFVRLVEVEREAAALLGTTLEQHERMLGDR